MKKSRHGERGGSAVETAIAMFLALFVVFAIIEAGRMLYTYHAVANAARLGSRYAMVRGSDCAVAGCPVKASDVQTYVRGVTPFTDPAAMTVTTTWTGTAYNRSACDGTTHHAGCTVNVQVSYNYSFIAPLVPRVALTLRSASQMVLTQ
jgi:Flp pilus assembly protein TadG